MPSRKTETNIQLKQQNFTFNGLLYNIDSMNEVGYFLKLLSFICYIIVTISNLRARGVVTKSIFFFVVVFTFRNMIFYPKCYVVSRKC